jgi:hypothetical protein
LAPISLMPSTFSRSRDHVGEAISAATAAK